MLTRTLAVGAVIDFPEQLVVLLDVLIVRIELQCLLVRLACIGQIALVLVGNREIVVGGGVGRIDIGGAFESRDRFAPQVVLGDVDAELHLLLRLAPTLLRESRYGGRKEKNGEKKGCSHAASTRSTIVTRSRAAQAVSASTCCSRASHVP